MARDVDRAEPRRRIEAGAFLLDAQGPGKYERAHLPGAVRGRLDDPNATVTLLGDDLDREVVVYCTDRNCGGSALAVSLLEGRGYRNVARYADGLADWIDAGLAVDGEPG